MEKFKEYVYQATIRETGEILESASMKGLYRHVLQHCRDEVGPVANGAWITNDRICIATIKYGILITDIDEDGYPHGFDFEELRYLGNIGVCAGNICINRGNDNFYLYEREGAHYEI